MTRLVPSMKAGVNGPDPGTTTVNGSSPGQVTVNSPPLVGAAFALGAAIATAAVAAAAAPASASLVLDDMIALPFPRAPPIGGRGIRTYSDLAAARRRMTCELGRRPPGTVRPARRKRR